MVDVMQRGETTMGRRVEGNQGEEGKEEDRVIKEL